MSCTKKQKTKFFDSNSTIDLQQLNFENNISSEESSEQIKMVK
jgi:hypothetical protein